MSNRQLVTVYICIDYSGEFAVGTDEDTACEAYENEIGGMGARIVREVTLSIPIPELVLHNGTALFVPDEAPPEDVKISEG